MTDTGSFRFPSTTARTHQVVRVIENGAQPHLINQKIYDTNSINRLKLLGTALRNLKKSTVPCSLYYTHKRN